MLRACRNVGCVAVAVVRCVVAVARWEEVGGCSHRPLWRLAIAGAARGDRKEIRSRFAHLGCGMQRESIYFSSEWLLIGKKLLQLVVLSLWSSRGS